jgi:hypothetical protein
MTGTVAHELRIGSAAVFRRRPSGRFRRCAAVGWTKRTPHDLDPESALIKDAFAAGEGHVRLHTGAWGRLGFERGVAVPTVALPISVFGEVRALALYGAHVHGDALNAEEVEALERLVTCASLAYESIEATALRRQVRALARRARDLSARSSPL